MNADNLDNYTYEHKRKVLKKIAEHLALIAEAGDGFSVDTELEALITGFFEPLSQEDWFGTEGWEEYFDFD